VGWLSAGLDPCEEVVVLVADAIADDPQGDVGGGKVVREGFSKELDELRSASQDARSYIAGLERRERERSGISNLKVGYNRVFGYYLEITKSNLGNVPEDYIRRQTLVNAERFFTPELKEYESLVLNAGERLEELEAALYRQVCRQISDAAERITQTASAIAAVDAFASLGEAAAVNNYVRPTLDDGAALHIKNGRHPVVERMLPTGSFIANDSEMATDANQLIMLTGPNMAGKSTYLRQVALIVLMAQVGSFVPADECHVGLVDRIFTRVGLQDDLAAGQSTFMVEMVETAAILHHATPRSLVVLDEIGRGTSTYDGLSIAQAVAEHIHNDPRLGCRTLFATHYHELTELADRLPRVANYSVAVSEDDGDVVFLHRIVAGGADRSYGVHVAQLAGLPRPVVSRAWELLAILEADDSANGKRPSKAKPAAESVEQQLDFFGSAAPEVSPVLEALRGLELNGMTPLEALNKLYELQADAGD
jgi:DNA mismatch repair protein MutS